MPSSPEADPKPTPEARGFGHSKRRVAAELGLIGGGLAVVVWLIWFLAGSLADYVAARIPVQADVSIGAQAWKQLAPESRRCTNDALVEYVEKLAKPLVDAANSPFEFRFAVIDDPAVNAFALPGGFVTVNSGLLSKARSGEEVAAVLAHELIHVTERHGTRRVARQMGSMVLLSVLFGGTDFETVGYAAGSLANTAYDRDEESAADTGGQRLLRAIGVSPAAMADFFGRLEGEGVSVPALLSTHPDPGDRAERAREAARGFVPTTTLPTPPQTSCR